MPVEKKTRFNVTYLLVALWGVLLIQGFIAARFRPKEIPYSAFLKALEKRESVEERCGPLERVARRLLEVEVLYAEEFERLAGCGAAPGPVGEAA